MAVPIEKGKNRLHKAERGLRTPTPESRIIDTDIQIELMKRPSHGRTSEHSWAEITRAASLCGVDYKSRFPTCTMYEYNKSTLSQMELCPATYVAALTIHPRFLNWRLHCHPKKDQEDGNENDSLIGWIQTVQNTFPDVMATWADTTKHLLLTDLRKLHGWEVVPAPLELEPIAVMSIICTELTARGIPLTTYWLTQVRTARVATRKEQPGKIINGKDSDRQASIGGRRALVRTMPINHRKGVNSVKMVHTFLGQYGETLGAFVPNSNKCICFVSFRHRAGLEAAIQAHPNGRTLFINGQMVNIVKAEMRGDEYHTEEANRQPQHAKLWDKDKTQQSQSSDGTQHIVLRNNGHVPQQLAGNRCVFAAIAHGLDHHHNSKTLRETTIQYITEGRSKLIEGVTIEDWIQPANDSLRNRTTIDEYAASLEAGGQGGDFEAAILADMMHLQIAIFIEHDLGYMHSTTYGNESGQQRVSILRTNDDRYIPFTFTRVESQDSGRTGADARKTALDDNDVTDNQGNDDHVQNPKTCSNTDADGEICQQEQDQPQDSGQQDTTWFKVTGVVPMEWFEIHRPFSIHDVIAAATPHCLRNSFHNEQQCHLRIVKGAPQGWLEHASTATLNHTDKITLERKIRTIQRSTQSLRSEVCHNTQTPSDTLNHADEGPGNPEQEKSNISAQGHTSGTKDTGMNCAIRAHPTSNDHLTIGKTADPPAGNNCDPDKQQEAAYVKAVVARIYERAVGSVNPDLPGATDSPATEIGLAQHDQSNCQQPHEAAARGPYPVDSITEEDGKIMMNTGKRPDTQSTATGVTSHIFRHATWTQTDIERACPQQWRRTTHLNLLLVEDNEEVMKSGRRPTTPTTKAFRCPAVPPGQVAPPQFAVTEVCVANADTLTAALIVGNAIALNFANATSPGGGYIRGAFAQEEDLCRLLPQLYPSLINCQAYPIQPDVALVTRKLLAVRHPGTYELAALPVNNSDTPNRECNILTAAMPGGNRDDPQHGSQEWIHTVRLRIRTVLHVARSNDFPNIILGAYGCGAFGNPPEEVAQMFVEQLQSPEFRGAFQRVVFAIIDPREDGNLKVFRNECARVFSEHRAVDEDT